MLCFLVKIMQMDINVQEFIREAKNRLIMLSSLIYTEPNRSGIMTAQCVLLHSNPVLQNQGCDV